MDLDPKCIFVQRERNLDVHHPVIKLVASLARNRRVTFTEIHILTTEANPLVAEIHDKKRMPVILTKAEEEIWLSKTLPLDTKMTVLDTFPEGLMKRVKVGKRVNAVSTLKKPNNDSDLLLPLNTDDDV